MDCHLDQLLETCWAENWGLHWGLHWGWLWVPGWAGHWGWSWVLCWVHRLGRHWDSGWDCWAETEDEWNEIATVSDSKNTETEDRCKFTVCILIRNQWVTFAGLPVAPSRYPS